MPTYTFTAPDGRTITVTGPEGSTTEQAFQVAMQQLQTEAQAPAPEEGINWPRMVAQAIGGAAGGAFGALGGPAAPVGVPLMAAGGSQLAGQLYDVATGAPPQTPMQTAQEFALEATAGPVLEKTLPLIAPLARRGAQAVGGAIGDVSAGAMDVATGALDYLGGRSTDIARRGQELAQAYPDIPMTPGQTSGARAQLGRENVARQNLGSADIMAAQDALAAQGLGRRTGRLAAATGGRELGESELGRGLQAMTEGRVGELYGFAKDSWRQLTRPIDEALPGGAIAPDNFNRTVDELIEEYSAIGTPKANRIVGELQRMSRTRAPQESMILDPTGQPFAPQEDLTYDLWQRLRTHYGRASKGAANIFGDIVESRDESKQVATRLFQALDQDIDQAPIPDELRQFHETAKSVYRKTMNTIERLEASPLGRNLGDALQDFAFGDEGARSIAGSRLVRQLVSRNVDRADLNYVTEVIRETDPQLLSDLQRYVVEDALAQARQIPPSMGIAAPELRPNVLAGKLPDDDVLSALGFSDQAISEIRDIREIAVRLGDKFGFNFSGTGPYMEASALAESASGMATMPTPGNVQRLLMPITKLLGNRTFAEGVVDPSIRQELLKQMEVLDAQKGIGSLMAEMMTQPMTPAAGAARGALYSGMLEESQLR